MTTYRAPMCIGCKHFHREGFTCDAFPNGIPDDILESRLDHRKPYPGDNGIQYEPVSAKAAAMADRIFPKDLGESDL